MTADAADATANTALIERFYAAFGRRDAAGMPACDHLQNAIRAQAARALAAYRKASD